MSLVYELIGRVVVRAVWWRWRSEMRIAGGVFATLLLVAGYLVARRTPPEG